MNQFVIDRHPGQYTMGAMRTIKAIKVEQLDEEAAILGLINLMPLRFHQ